ncbi:MAG: hypothetical protein ACI4IF_03485 [Acutalibacteraceae bacterium]
MFLFLFLFFIFLFFFAFQPFFNGECIRYIKHCKHCENKRLNTTAKYIKIS